MIIRFTTKHPATALSILTFYGFFFTYSFEVGFVSRFGVPAEMILIDFSILLRDLSLFTILIIILYLFINIVLSVFEFISDAKFGEAAFGIITKNIYNSINIGFLVFIITMYVIRYFFGKNIYIDIFMLFAFIVFFFNVFLSIRFTKWESDTAFSNITLVASALLAFSFATFMIGGAAGAIYAKERKLFASFSDSDGRWILVAVYGDRMIFSGVDPKMSCLSGSIRVISASALQLHKLRQLHLAHIYDTDHAMCVEAEV